MIWFAAGREWQIPEVHYSISPNGSLGVSMLEAARIHRIIEYRLLEKKPGDDFSDEEVKFLLDIKSTRKPDLEN